MCGYRWGFCRMGSPYAKKPCILFGSIWYQGCKSVHNITKIDDLKKAFEKIISGQLPDSKDLEFFLECLLQASSKNSEYLNEKQIPSRLLNDYRKSIPSLGKDLVKTLKKVYTKQ